MAHICFSLDSLLKVTYYATPYKLLILLALRTYPLKLWISLFITLENYSQSACFLRFLSHCSFFNRINYTIKTMSYSFMMCFDHFLIRKYTYYHPTVHNPLEIA